MKEKQTMDFFYDVALEEGEGMGTAYEYIAKKRILKNFLKNKKIETILVYGIPEKYGTSMDFFFFSKFNNKKVYFYETDKKLLKKLKFVREKLNERGFSTKELKIIKRIPKNKKYDLILSCEVFQRLNKKERENYLKNIKLHGKYAVIFVPNKYNKAHDKISHLNTLSFEDINEELINAKLIEKGFVDFPPFPPGIKVSHAPNKKRKKIKGIKKIILLLLLNFWVRIEKYLQFHKQGYHMIYKIIKI